MTIGDCQSVSGFVLASFENLLSSPQLVPLAILVLAIWLLLRRPRRPTGLATTGQRKPPVANSADDRLRRDLESLMAELQELSRKISAEIDTRFAKLEAAMRDADRRIAALNRLTRKTGKASKAAADDPAGPDIRHEIVHELADSGMTPIRIAKELGKTPGEVELILNLRGKMPSTTAAPPPSKNSDL
ncbi:MAG TPA: hypothetical protein VLM89_17160 [Phycisphaerae bacterium]|nr:hypothetical protein [Phycisphaerae bacterium]